jgi:hypothetical protein
VPTHSMCSKRTQQFAQNALNLLTNALNLLTNALNLLTNALNLLISFPEMYRVGCILVFFQLFFHFFCFRGRRERREGGARADTLTLLKLSKDVSGLLFSVLLFSYSFNCFSIFVLEEGVRGEREEEGDPRFRGRRMGFWKERLRPTFCQ